MFNKTLNLKNIIKGRWAIFIIWFLAAVVLKVIQPDINSILPEKEQSALSEDSDSVKADKILKKMSITKGTCDKLGITEMIEQFTLPKATSLYSKYGTALMVNLKVDKGDTRVNDLYTDIEFLFPLLPHFGTKSYCGLFYSIILTLLRSNKQSQISPFPY